MGSFANLILNNAQTVYDGGLISKILQNVQLFNNSNVKSDIMPYIKSSRMSGGYATGLFFGILWILLLISVMIILFYLHCKKIKLNFRKKRVSKSNGIQLKKDKTESTITDYLKMFIIVIFLIPIVIFLCFSISNVSQIHDSISTSSKRFSVNSTKEPTAILPAIRKSLFHLRQYLSTLSENARQNTASVVGEIIQATKDMQRETMKDFNPKLMRDLGVENTFKYGAEMTNIVVTFFDISTSLLDKKTMYTEIINSIYPRVMNPPFRLFNFISDIKKSFENLPNCDEECTNLRNFFNQSFEEVNEFPDISFATSFLFVMKQQNKTRQSVIAQTQHGRKEMRKTMAKTQRRMKELLDIDGTIRNMTDETWTKMDGKFVKLVELIDNMTTVLESEKTESTCSRYSHIAVVFLIIPILFAMIILILAIVVIVFLFIYPSKTLHIGLQYGIYLSLFLLSLILLISTIMFLHGGKMETELCRYLRTDQPLEFTPNGTRLVLDKYINDFLHKTLPKLAATMPKSDFPLPKPNNVMYGLIHRCRKNEPILAAIDAISNMDTSALSKPEISQKFVNIGRMLLIESLNETDPKKMLPPDMEKTLQQASQLQMFKEIDINGSIQKVPRTPIFVSTSDGKKPISTGLFLDRLAKYLDVYVSDTNIKRDLQKSQNQLLPLIERFNIITDTVRNIFGNITSIPPIIPVVDNLKKSLDSMINLMKNKTALIQIGNDKFDKVIVSSTPKKAAGIMAKYGPKMMSQLGHCKPLFEAYQSSIDTTCDVIVMKVNAYWLYLGAVGLFLTCFLSIVLVMMLRTHDSSTNSNVYKLDMSKETSQSVGKPLFEDSTKEKEKTEV